MTKLKIFFIKFLTMLVMLSSMVVSLFLLLSSIGIVYIGWLGFKILIGIA